MRAYVRATGIQHYTKCRIAYTIPYMERRQGYSLFCLYLLRSSHRTNVGKWTSRKRRKRKTETDNGKRKRTTENGNGKRKTENGLDWTGVDWTHQKLCKCLFQCRTEASILVHSLSCLHSLLSRSKVTCILR